MSAFKRIFAVVLVAAALMGLCGCSSKPKKAECEVISMQFVDTVKINGVTVKYDGYKIVEVKINAYSPEKFPTTCPPDAPASELTVFPPETVAFSAS